jgi:predicted transcriptional regulator
MKSDGHTIKDIAKFLGASPAALDRYLAETPPHDDRRLPACDQNAPVKIAEVGAKIGAR